MIKQKDILDEKKKILRQVSKEVTFPLSKEDISLIKDMHEYLRKSQNEDYAEKENIRAGMGLAFSQVGLLKRIFVISLLEDDGHFTEYTIINPKIVSHSEEKIYVEEGEGCLSVNREVIGIIPRFARITVEYRDINGKICSCRVREDMAVAFQHEIDHLNGILFIDKITNNIDGIRTI